MTPPGLDNCCETVIKFVTLYDHFTRVNVRPGCDSTTSDGARLSYRVEKMDSSAIHSPSYIHEAHLVVDRFVCSTTDT